MLNKRYCDICGEEAATGLLVSLVVCPFCKNHMRWWTALSNEERAAFNKEHHNIVQPVPTAEQIEKASA